jgi:pyridinium-3,5-biscarboxylic acid mononucleotide sulfurtransferase
VTLPEKAAVVEGMLREASPVLVAYSGGVDSACLLALAARAEGVEVLGVVADSPSLPRESLRVALEVARVAGAEVEVVATREFEREEYVSNPPNRCYFCKAELFQRMEEVARERGYRRIAYGENADDPAMSRPGSRAAAEFRVLAPLREAGLGKAEVRELARMMGLPVHDAPAQPCLSSRIPHGMRVSREALAMVEEGEARMRRMGYRIFRVRHAGEDPPAALVQVDPRETVDAGAVVAALREAGYAEVRIDPAGYRPPGGVGLI